MLRVGPVSSAYPRVKPREEAGSSGRKLDDVGRFTTCPDTRALPRTPPMRCTTGSRPAVHLTGTPVSFLSGVAKNKYRNHFLVFLYIYVVRNYRPAPLQQEYMSRPLVRLVDVSCTSLLSCYCYQCRNFPKLLINSYATVYPYSPFLYILLPLQPTWTATSTSLAPATQSCWLLKRNLLVTYYRITTKPSSVFFFPNLRCPAKTYAESNSRHDARQGSFALAHRGMSQIPAEKATWMSLTPVYTYTPIALRINVSHTSMSSC